MPVLADLLAGARARVALYGGVSGALSAVASVLRREGWRGALRKVARASARQSGYQRWIEECDTPSPEALQLLREEVLRLPRRPVISLVVPVYNTPQSCLIAMIESVIAQIYPNWELCLADDASSAPHVRRVLSEYAQRDARVKVIFRQQNGHICAASNSALELAMGEFVALLDHDDLLPVHALATVVKSLNAYPHARLLYSDEDKISADGRRSSPYFKAAWDPELILQQNVFSHLGVYETQLMREVGGFRLGLEGSQDHDLILRCLQLAGDNAVVHIPHVLYHWRAIAGSTAVDAAEKPYAQDASWRAVAGHLLVTGVNAEVAPPVADFPFIAVRYRLPSPAPAVHIIVDSRAEAAVLDRHLESLFAHTDYASLRVSVVRDERAGETTAAAPKQRFSMHRVEGGDAARVEAVNRLVEAGSEPFVCLLHDQLSLAEGDWLEQLVRHAARAEIGLAGAMLRRPDATTWAAGLVLTGPRSAVAAHTGVGRRDPGYFGANMLTRSVSALPCSGVAIRRSAWIEAGGLRALPEREFEQAVDFSARVAATGLRHVLVPAAEIVCVRDSRDFAPRENVRGAGKHAREGALDDPRYSPNLALSDSGASFELSFARRTGFAE